MSAYIRALALVLVPGGVLSPALALAKPVHAAAAGVQDAPNVPPQVTYQFTVTTRGVSVETAHSSDDTIFGTVTLACLDDGGAAVVSRDVKFTVRYEGVVRTPPKEDLALRPYSRVFSELRRIAWNICTPTQAVAPGEERGVEQGGLVVVKGFRFPNQISIQDRLGSIGCEGGPDDKTARAFPCTLHIRPQPFISTLERQVAQ